MFVTKSRWRFRLPHWEVSGQPHFITVRCAGSLPREAVQRLQEIHQTLQSITAHSAAFEALQRKYFHITESYLDAGHGDCPFRNPEVCHLALAALDGLRARTRWRPTDVTLMPNHVHLLLLPDASATPLRHVLRGWKWQVACEANHALHRTGAFWQSDWFDRWSRHEAETARLRQYIRNNPVKAGLVRQWRDYPWTVSETERPSAAT